MGMGNGFGRKHHNIDKFYSALYEQVEVKHMQKVTEETLKEFVSKGKSLVFFYLEKGCSFCDQMKPVVEEYAKTRDVQVLWYELGQTPDSVTKGLVRKAPTFVAFKDGAIVGKLEGVQSLEQLDNIDQPKFIPVEEATLEQLLKDEAYLIDQIFPIKTHLLKVQAEIKRRRDGV